MILTSIGLVSCSCAIGAAIPEFVKNFKASHSQHQYIHAFTNGMLLGMAMLFFMPEIVEHAGKSPWLLTLLALSMLITKLLSSSKQKGTNNFHVTSLLYGSLSMHNIIECTLLGYYINEAIGITWLFAIAAHKWAETCCINIRLNEFGYQTTVRIILITFFISAAIASLLFGQYLYDINHSITHIHDYAIYALIITTGYLIESSLQLDCDLPICEHGKLSKKNQIIAMIIGLLFLCGINIIVETSY